MQTCPWLRRAGAALSSRCADFSLQGSLLLQSSFWGPRSYSKYFSLRCYRLQYGFQEEKSKSLSPDPTLCNLMDCSLPGSSVHGNLQARILEWVAPSLLQGIFPTRGSNPGLLHCRRVLYRLSHWGNMHSIVCIINILLEQEKLE